MTLKHICDVCDGDTDVLPCPAAFHPHKLIDLCVKCRRDLQDKRDAAAAAGKNAPPPDVNR